MKKQKMSKSTFDSFYYVGLVGYNIKYGDGSSMLYNDVVCASSKKEAIKLFCADILNKNDYEFVVFPITSAVFIRVNNFGCFVFVSSDKYCGVVDMYTLDHSCINYIQSICKYNIKE